MAEENPTKQGGIGTTGTGAPEAKSNLESSKTHARRAAEDLKTAATTMAGEYRGKAEQAWGDAQDRVHFQEDGEAYVRENPTKAVFTALGIGFLLGVIFRR